MISIGFIVVLIDLILQIRISIRKKNITYGFLSLTIFGAMTTILGNIFINLNIEGAIAINLGLDLFFTSMLVTTSIVALLEERILQSEKRYRESYNRASFYKDLVSHDINNILQSIRISTDLIPIYSKDNNNVGAVEELREIINEQIEKGSLLIKNIKILSDIEEQSYPIHQVELIQTLEKSIDFINKSYQEKSTEIKIVSEFKEINILANELLPEVFENILFNAIKHNDKDKVKVSIEISQDITEDLVYHKIEFKDNGKGITDLQKNQLFRKSPLENRKGSGMGLGLSLVKKIVESYNGKIWVEDTIKGDYSKGSNFIIIIPEIPNNN
jgi:signal transduction histidine kinase